jgi:hypothetical protein
MTLMKSKLLVILFLAIVLFSQNRALSQEKKWTIEDSCYSYLNIYREFWKKDNLGKNGLRQLLADYILKKCDFKGQPWEKLRPLLGTPTHTRKLEQSVLYRYRLNYLSKEVTVGTELLEIVVDKSGLIISFSVFTIDG